MKSIESPPRSAGEVQGTPRIIQDPKGSKLQRVLGASLRNRPGEKLAIYDSLYIVGSDTLITVDAKQAGEAKHLGKRVTLL
ncbi:MAG: hypothetical protein J7J19_02015 [Thaumarchaeota archaeon]|nr:hypothetical protein [Nitrososphaerota archaeon]